ncbi:MAG: SpoIID/LytB domain-containing protein [Marinilabiliales bacterium]|nr:SpoIID/LytB domain-containing protein [Marinilabiliales bacterium]
MAEAVVYFSLDGTFQSQPAGLPDQEMMNATIREGHILINGKETGKDTILFEPVDPSVSSFHLHDVTIGVEFHWERKESQRFRGALQLRAEEGKVQAINILPLEDYLISVISSEMSATSSMELLKAHAVISRSWLIAQVIKGSRLGQSADAYQTIFETEGSYIRWYDREDHHHFDVCADDHCQRYQGITRQTSPLVEQAIRETSGLLLTYDGEVCDARFSKSCGGISETFENAWEPVVHPYLQPVHDVASGERPGSLTDEQEADRFIRSSPPAFCNTTDKRVLSQVLNDYDQETTDFYRWKISYTQAEIASLIRTKSGFDFGEILDLIPVERGESGRILRLKVVGSKLTKIIGKELQIRKILSHSHLYSSAFVVDKMGDGPIPASFLLTGAGWGHGVGLCQIGAAVMGDKGYPFDAILRHYFVGAVLEKRY